MPGRLIRRCGCAGVHNLRREALSPPCVTEPTEGLRASEPPDLFTVIVADTVDARP